MNLNNNGLEIQQVMVHANASEYFKLDAQPLPFL